ncbi:unnamed protein product, partial [Mesorhabditis belari]|uniref:Alpha-type protein kinase domain-containing protein n=1 Tax=Mesorhabditis belari TaxID=2138241 RepID=A0AAF3EVB1_9BILA
MVICDCPDDIIDPQSLALLPGSDHLSISFKIGSTDFTPKERVKMARGITTESSTEEAEESEENNFNPKDVSFDAEWKCLAPLHEISFNVQHAENARRKLILDRWRSAAARAVRRCVDPWRKYNIHEMPILRARRFRYSATRKTWLEDFVEIKMCHEPFARGAMRECFRVKKLSSMGYNQGWENAHNYVAKRYIQEVDRQVIFDDVKLQLDCKLWSEEFNRNNPPKKIDIVQMNVLQILDLPGEPLYHLEHYIEGDYVKYNSNSGFVSDLQRKTPQAFSHFTFERSGHQMIVVDVQGVGDLYTDPQIHTVNGTEYGDGNLGTRGMALFFHSHICNDICHMLCLTEFDLSQSEKNQIADESSKATPNMEPTHFVRKREKDLNICQPLLDDLTPDDAMECLRQRSDTLRQRSRSRASSIASSTSPSAKSQEHDEDCTCETCIQAICADAATMDDESDEEEEDCGSSGYESQAVGRKVGRATLSVESADRVHRRRTNDSMCSSYGGSSRLTAKTEREEFWMMQRKKSMPAGVVDILHMKKQEAAELRHISILGQIHLDLARYHENGRFIREEDANQEKKKVFEELTKSGSSVSSDDSGQGGHVRYDREAALFHLDVARRCGNSEAILTIAKMCYHLPHDLLKDIGDDIYWFADTEEELDTDPEKFAFELMLSAAEMGDRGAILFVAQCYETGHKMGRDATISYPLSIFWLEKGMGFADDEEGTEQHRPRHESLATMARLYQEGGYGLEQDLSRAYELYTEAAESAAENMKGKLASKYYEYAEMCAE